jgi:hypothetical protein
MVFVLEASRDVQMFALPIDNFPLNEHESDKSFSRDDKRRGLRREEKKWNDK